MTPHTAKIRPGQKGDEARLSLIGATTYLESFAGKLDGIVDWCATHHGETAYRQLLESSTARTWIAEVNPGAAPVGYSVIDRPTFATPGLHSTDYELKRLYVLKRFQLQGIGTDLLKDSLQQCREFGAQRVLMRVFAGNLGALKFYARSHASQIGSTRDCFGQTEYDFVILAVDLAKALTS